MTALNEHNFLERLMPHLQQRNGPKRQACPDSTALSAFTENRLGGSERDAVATHLTQCSSCAELHDRLVGFSKATTAAQDPEWENTEKRLAIWMGGFLDAHASARESADRTRAASSAKEWGWWPSWKFQWALSGIAALALIAGATFLLKSKLPWRAEEQQAAAQKSRPGETPTTQPAAETKVVASAEKAVTGDQAGPGGQPAAVASKTSDGTAGARRNILDSGERKIPLEVGEQKSELAGTPPASPQAEPQPHSEPSQVAHADIPADRPATQAAPPASHGPTSGPATRATGATASGKPSVELATQPVAGTQSASGIQQGQTTAASSAPAKGGAHSAANAMARPAMVHPSIYRFAADTRLWIKLDAVNRQSDGSFTFQGSLLEPVTEAGGALLRRGTQVVGSGTLNQGKTSLVVGQIVIGADRYNLKGASGGTNAPGPGAGPAVEFEAGKVLEMFLDSTSVYEKTPQAKEQLQAPN